MTEAPPRQKFDAEFIERRMREHKSWQRTKASHLAVEILEEIVPMIALRLHRVKDSRLNTGKIQQRRLQS